MDGTAYAHSGEAQARDDGRISSPSKDCWFRLAGARRSSAHAPVFAEPGPCRAGSASADQDRSRRRRIGETGVAGSPLVTRQLKLGRWGNRDYVVCGEDHCGSGAEHLSAWHRRGGFGIARTSTRCFMVSDCRKRHRALHLDEPQAAYPTRRPGSARCGTRHGAPT